MAQFTAHTKVANAIVVSSVNALNGVIVLIK